MRWFAVAILCLAVGVNSTLYEEKERIAREIYTRMKEPVKYLRPPVDKLNVSVNFYVRNIFKMDKDLHRWLVQLTFRQEWVDHRLIFTPKEKIDYLNYGHVKDIWLPDLFFKEEVMPIDDHKLMTPNELVHIYPNGRVLYSKRITLDLYCPVDFRQKNFVCPLTIASYMYTKDDLDLVWKTDNPVQISSKLRIPIYTLNGVSTKKDITKTTVGDFSSITALFNFGYDVCHA